MLAEGLQAVLPAGSLTVITNTADDLELWGLAISPDTDAVLYRLAGIFNEKAHWGVEGETFAMLEMLKRYGEDAWFGLGDRDLATHLLRTHLLQTGMGAAAVTADLAFRLGLSAQVIPMSEQPVRTKVTTPKGRLDLQEYFVRERHALPVSAVEIVGAEDAAPAPGVAEALREADRIIIGLQPGDQHRADPRRRRAPDRSRPHHGRHPDRRRRRPQGPDDRDAARSRTRGDPDRGRRGYRLLRDDLRARPP